jgi:hypothetical protein
MFAITNYQPIESLWAISLWINYFPISTDFTDYYYYYFLFVCLFFCFGYHMSIWMDDDVECNRNLSEFDVKECL